MRQLIAEDEREVSHRKSIRSFAFGSVQCQEDGR